MFEMRPRFDAKNFKSFAKNLKSSVSNLEPAFDEFGRYIQPETQRQFTTETDPDGNKWAELSPVTLLRKQTPYILRETFFMYSMIFYVATKNSFEFGIRDPKYKFHHEGTAKMPARVVIGITDKRKQRLNRIIIVYLKRVRSRRARV